MRVQEYEASAQHVVSMGGYENVKLGVRVVVVGDENDNPDDLREFARMQVERGLAGDLERAIETTGDPDSYIETWVDGPPPPPPPARKRRVARNSK